MIKRLKALVLWLESRFPEKVMVTAEGYSWLRRDVDHTAAELTTWIGEIANLKERVGAVEYKSAHVDAVKELVKHVEELKNEVSAMKAALGWAAPSAKQAEINAMLNGEAI